jgi:hypothetical protein
MDSLEQSYHSSPDDITYDYNPFRIKSFQSYNPMYDRFLPLTETNYNSIQLNHKYHFINPVTVKDCLDDTMHQKNVFIKYSPLLDPIRYMIGKYAAEGDLVRQLPQFNASGFPKIYDKNNAAYTDCFFSYLTSKTLHEYGFVNGIDFYGSFLGVQDKYKMNVADDIEYLNTSPFFNENVNKLFTICNHDAISYYADSSRANRIKLRISSANTHNISAISLTDIITVDEPTADLGETETVYENHGKTETSNKSSSNSSSSSDNSDYNDSSDSDGDCDDSNDDEDWETEEDDSECGDSDSNDNDCDDESMSDDVQHGYINNFPVQLICLEKCIGTIDDLLIKRKLDENKAAAALFQVIMTLIAYQKMFHFTHNDLHTNNIMYIETDEPYLYYKYENITYKVPTYGRIFKLIDFGRSIYKFNGNTICSDSFAPGGDAATQYNCEPFFDNTKPVLEPNYSFDLCRLGCSIYDFIIPDDEDYSKYDELQKTIHRWCLDDRGKNVLYKRNGDERYPNFKLYKMAARTVHEHTPQAQLKYPFFKQFKSSSDKNTAFKCMDIDKLPCCV